METLNIVKTIYLKDKIHTIRIIEKVNFEPTKDFDAIVYIDKEVYTYFKRNNIFEISLKELTKAENKKFEIDMKMLDVLENVIFSF